MQRSAFGLLVAWLVLFAPVAAAQAAQEEATPADPRFRNDAAACWAHVVPGSDTACAVQYAHIVDPFGGAPLFLQRPPDDAEDIATGLGVVPGFEPVWDLNQVVLRPTPLRVEYGDERIHAEHGIAGDLRLDPDVPLFGYWSMSADMDEFAPLGVDQHPEGSDPGIGALPCLTVRMTVETGSFPGRGEVLTGGQQTKTVVTGAPVTDHDEPDVPPHLCTGDREAPVHIDDVVTFEIEMPPIRTPIAKETSFHVQVSWWNHAPGDPDDQDKLYLQWWNLHSGPDYVPRIVLPVERLIQVDSVAVYADDEMMYIEGWFNSVFGPYGVDPGTIRLQVFDQDLGEVEINHIGPPLLRIESSHDGHFKPLRAIIPWDHEFDGLPPGPYTLRLSANDLQGNAVGVAETQLVLLAPVEESPVPVIPFLGLVLLALLAGRRRSAA